MLPTEFLERMEKMLGEEYPEFLESYEKNEYKALRINPIKTSAADFQKKWESPLSKIEWEEEGFYYEGDIRPGKHPYHDGGVYYIQEPSAMAPVHYLEPKPGERILDLCAAPGGKSTQIGGKMRGRGLLVSNEIHPSRARILSENIERMGIANAVVLNEDPKRLAERFAGFFDKILVDAPCSGEGMFRKNEEAKEEWSPENVEKCAKRQDEILDLASKMLKPGGRIVYSTCTFSREENEGSIQRFMENHPDFYIQDVPLFSGMAKSKWGIRLWPHKIKGEGHFFSVIQKKEETVFKETAERTKKVQFQKGQPVTAYPEFMEFCLENGLDQCEKADFMDGTYITFGEQLYLLPDGVPSLDKLRVLRPGLHVANIKKGRSEPAHALSHVLCREDMKHWISYSGKDEEIQKYLHGQTLNVQGEKGWTLVCVDSYGLGFGKITGGILKNHYPKGLRTL